MEARTTRTGDDNDASKAKPSEHRTEGTKSPRKAKSCKHRTEDETQAREDSRTSLKMGG